MAATPANSSARIATTTEAPARLAPSKATTASSDYAAREKSSKDLAEFKGGHAGYIAVPVGTIILVTVLLIILL